METNPYPNEAFAKVDGRRRVSGFSALRSLIGFGMVPDAVRTPYRGTGNKPKRRQSRRSTVNTNRRHFRHWKAKRRGKSAAQTIAAILAILAGVLGLVAIGGMFERSMRELDRTILLRNRLAEIKADRTQVLEDADRIRENLREQLELAPNPEARSRLFDVYEESCESLEREVAARLVELAAEEDAIRLELATDST